MKDLTYTEFVADLFYATEEINVAARKEEKTLRFVCEEVADRLWLYLRLPSEDVDREQTPLFDPRLVKIAAKVASRVFTGTESVKDGKTDDTAISSLSDNGQSISYGEAAKNYLATVEDGELFSGVSRLLNDYRRIRVYSR